MQPRRDGQLGFAVSGPSASSLRRGEDPGPLALLSRWNLRLCAARQNGVCRKVDALTARSASEACLKCARSCYVGGPCNISEALLRESHKSFHFRWRATSSILCSTTCLSRLWGFADQSPKCRILQQIQASSPTSQYLRLTNLLYM